MIYDTRTRCVAAGVQLWAAQGKAAVTARAVGDAAGVSRTRVCQLFDGMDGLRRACEEQARRDGNVSILAQIAAGG